MRIRILVIGQVFVSNLIFMLNVNCQSLIDPELKSLYYSSDSKNQDYIKPLRDSKNDIDIIVSTSFLFYKTFFSSQDVPKCIFTPSCSEYAVEAIQKKGLIIGWLSSIDRLSRCHGLVLQNHYPFDYDKKRFYDPVH